MTLKLALTRQDVLPKGAKAIPSKMKQQIQKEIKEAIYGITMVKPVVDHPQSQFTYIGLKIKALEVK